MTPEKKWQTVIQTSSDMKQRDDSLAAVESESESPAEVTASPAGPDPLSSVLVLCPRCNDGGVTGRPRANDDEVCCHGNAA